MAYLESKPRYEILDGLRGVAALMGWEGHIAVVRLAFPILAGLLISRCRRFIIVPGGFWLCSLLIMVSISVPHLGSVNGIYEALIILQLFPVIIAIGAGSRMNDPRSQRVCKFLGDISFPLYITHIFARYLQMAWKEAHADLPVSTHIMVSVSLYILALLVAYAALKLYDEPVREWLKEKWLKSRKK